MYRLLFVTLISLFATVSVSAARQVRVVSPDGKVRFTLNLSSRSMDYCIHYGSDAVVESSQLGFVFDSGAFGKNIRLVNVSRSQVDEKYELISGKVSMARDYCNEAVVALAENGASGRKIELIVRAYNDGVAFRTRFPKQPNWNGCVIYDELTTFNPAGDPQSLLMYLPGYINTHENTYSFIPFSQIKSDTLIEMPLTMQLADDLYASITEASVRNYAGMYLMRRGESFVSALSPKLGQQQVKVTIDTFPHVTPWRVVQVADRVGALIESTILTNLNEPCAVDDCSWIKPCSTTFPWWNGNIVPDTTFSPGNNFMTNKYYIDFAARNNIALHDIYGYAETAWYTDDSYNFGVAGANADVTRPVASLDMEQTAAYARSKGVGLHLWVHWLSLYRQLDQAFALYESWGVRGLMVDFMDRDDQDMIRIQEEILSSAARHHLFIQFHGSSKPSGLNRTYPNEFTREGTLNYEVCKCDTKVDADHDISIPFTRMLAGAADYHLGGFRAATRDNFVVRYTNPMVMSTRSHMLAMYVVLENHLVSLCDTPMAYEGQQGFDFLCRVPARWDDVKVVDARLNKYVAIARRNGSDWWIGAITDCDSRSITLPLDFLDSDCNYLATIYSDTPRSTVDPNSLDVEKRVVKSGEKIVVELCGSGGAAISLIKIM